jgi:CRP/FNR family transcriptional regulator
MALLLAQGELKQSVIETGSKVRYDRGDFLFCRGDEVRGVFLILKGEVRLGLDKNPSAFPTRDLGPGNLLGLPATLSNSAYSLTAEVIADCEVIFLSRPAMLELLRQHTNLSFEVMNLLSEELVETRNALSRIHKIRA